MPRPTRTRMLRIIKSTFRTDEDSVPKTEALYTVDEYTTVQILDLAMRIGESMLAVGSSAHEVALGVSRVTHAYGLRAVHVDVTYDSITVSYHPHEDVWPMTLMRLVRMTAADHTKLQRLQALVLEIEEGLELQEARQAFRLIRRTPFPYRTYITLIAQALLATGVSIMFGAPPVAIGLTFLAAFCAALAQAGLAKTGLPMFFNQIAGGLAVTAVAIAVTALGEAGVTAFQGIRPSIIVVSGIMMMLAGMAVVGAAQDAIDGFAVTATGRILDLVMRTAGLVLGILIGLELGRALGFGIVLHADAPAFGSLTQQLFGAMIVAVAAAVTNGAALGTMIVSGGLGILAMLGFALSVSWLALNGSAASGIGALAASFAGVLIAHRFHVPAVAVTTAAIIPLVPGSAVFRGLLSLVQAEGTTEGLQMGATSLVLAAMTGVALATGASLGLYLGTPVRATLRSVAKSRVGLRR